MRAIIHPEGKKTVSIGIFLYMILLAILIITACNPYFSLGFGLLGFILISFLFLFFRNPDRKIRSIDNSIVFAPADGKIVDIDTVFEKEYLKQDCLKVSIFMSIWNVHVNRYPLSGLIKYSKYHPGKYFIASYPKSSELNEHHSFVLETPEGISILVKQIAGALARRVVNYAKLNKQAIQGDDVGFIKFGSRVDMFLPLNTEILVKINEKVKGNLTVIARLSDKQY